MARLLLSLLGPFQLALNGEAVTSWKSNKVRALLAYLVEEAGRSFHRDSLAALFWPERPDRTARNNLRYTLYHLRQTIADAEADPPLVMADRQTIEFNVGGDYCLDTAVIRNLRAFKLADPHSFDCHQDALSLRRGPFLEGFSLAGCAEFQEWLHLRRDFYDSQVTAILACLVHAFELRGDIEMAERYTWQWLEVDPWDESAQQALLRILAGSGRRAAALAHFERFRHELAENLGLEPAQETLALVAEIRAGQLTRTGG